MYAQNLSPQVPWAIEVPLSLGLLPFIVSCLVLNLPTPSSLQK